MTERQYQLLDAIIREFIINSEAVGSVRLVEKYKLPVSSATIRNEMAELMRLGFLAKEHLSSGRVPTTQAYKKLVEQIFSDEPELKLTLATTIREELFRVRFDIDELIYKALQILFEESGNVGFALLGKRIYHFGLSRIPNLPEYKQVEGLCNLIYVMEDNLLLQEVFSEYEETGETRVIFGEDLKMPIFKNMVIIYSPVLIYESKKVHLGLIGSQRLDYNKLIPLVRYVAKSVSDCIAGW
jgi:heat-inducible transcriptional repressor